MVCLLLVVRRRNVRETVLSNADLDVTGPGHVVVPWAKLELSIDRPGGDEAD